MTSDELFDILQPIVKLVTGVPVCILADPNKPSPQGEYASIRPKVGIDKRGSIVTRKTSMVPDSVDIGIRRQIACSAWVQFYRGEALDRAELLIDCNKRSDISTTLFKNNLGWRSTSAVNNLTGLQSNNFEQRAQITVNLWYTTTDALTINSIESTSVEVQYEDGTVIVTEDIDT